MKAENAYNKEIGLLWEQGGHNLSATYYRNRISNLIANDQNFIPRNVANAKLEGLTLGYGGQLAGFDLTASIGATWFSPLPGEDAVHLDVVWSVIEHADTLLYRAKQAGRDRVTVQATG